MKKVVLSNINDCGCLEVTAVIPETAIKTAEKQPRGGFKVVLNNGAILYSHQLEWEGD